MVGEESMFSVVEAFGVQVVEVDRLTTAVCWVEDEKTALIRRDLDERTRSWVADWLLPRAAGLPAPPSQPLGR